MKIFKVSVGVDSSGWGQNVSELVVEKETKNSYLLYKERISKEKIMKIDTIFMDDHKYYRYFTYCLEPDVELAKQLLKEKIIEKIEKIEKEFKIILNLKNK